MAFRSEYYKSRPAGAISAAICRCPLGLVDRRAVRPLRAGASIGYFRATCVITNRAPCEAVDE